MRSALSQMLSVTFLGVREDSCVTSCSDNIFLKINLSLYLSLGQSHYEARSGPETHYIDQVGFEPTEICRPLLC